MNNIGRADLELLKELHPSSYKEMLEKIKNHYPIQYLIGYVDFFNLKLEVNESVLIPRFETELLVEKTIKYLKDKNYKNILDIGTGSGAIAIALSKNLDIEVEACDISESALKTAKENATKESASVNFFKKDILNEELFKNYDCIISNPPYVTKEEYVSPETKYEPSLALYANNEGLEFYEKIIYLSSKYLNKNGSIILEIGATQKEAIKKIALSYFPDAKIITEKDYNNFDRFMFIKT